MKLLTVFLLTLATAGVLSAQSSDPVVFRFSAIGDSRQEPGDPRLTATDAVWLQETRVLTRVYREIQAAKAQALFFSGDMIMGYTTDVNVLNRQYAFWRGMTSPLFETGTYVVPVPGNHEVQERGKDAAGKTFKLAREGNEAVWRNNMGDLIVDLPRWKAVTGTEASAFAVENTPQAGGADKITTDQRQLSFSFDVGTIHFAALNTDPVGNDSHAPAHWLADDFAAASTRGAKTFFLVAHKPAFTYRYNAKVEAGGLDIDPASRDEFWAVVEKFKATAIFGHEHIYHVEQPTKANGGKSWQVIAGTAGSPFDAKVGDSTNPLDRSYVWTLFEVRKSGKVHFSSFGFDDAFGPSKLVDEFDLN
jgi:hypothetical protein